MYFSSIAFVTNNSTNSLGLIEGFPAVLYFTLLKSICLNISNTKSWFEMIQDFVGYWSHQYHAFGQCHANLDYDFICMAILLYPSNQT